MATGTTGMLPLIAAMKAPARKRLGKKAQRLAAARGLHDLAGVTGALRRLEPFHEAGPGAPHQEMSDRHVAHLALDDEREARREESLEEDPVEIARVVGDDDTRSGRQVIQAVDLGPHPGKQERGACSPCDEPSPALEPGHQDRDQK